MGAENATTFDLSGQAAITQQEMDERSFSVPMSENDDDTEAQPRVGQPKVESKAEELPEKFRGKTVADVAKSAEEAERRMHAATEATRQAEQAARNYQEQASQERSARLRYEQMLAERQPPPVQPNQEIREEFRQNVNNDEKVLNTVEKLVDHKAREIVSKTNDPRIDDLERRDQLNRTQLFNINLQSKVSLNPEMGNLLPEIRQAAAEELNYIAETMLARGIEPGKVKSYVSDLNLDMNFVDSCYKKVVGSKGKDYWLTQTQSSAADDAAKLQLGGGGGGTNPDEGDVSDRALLNMAAKPGGSKDMRVELEKAGLLRRR